MLSRTLLPFASSREPSEWNDFDYLRPATSRSRTALALLITFLVFVADICWPRTNLSIFYLLPLLLLARPSDLRYLWRIVGLFIALTFSAYLVKKWISPLGATTSYFHYSLLNRSFVAAMLVTMAAVLRLWVRGREEQANPELPETLRYEDREIGATLAVACSAPLVLLTGAIDFLSPANYNVAIFYVVPLFTCLWTRSRLLLWAMLAILLVLATVAPIAGPPSTDPNAMSEEAVRSVFRNRVAAGCVLVVVAGILHYWIGRKTDL